MSDAPQPRDDAAEPSTGRRRSGRKPLPAPPPVAGSDQLVGEPAKPATINRDKVASGLWDALVPVLAASKAIGRVDGVIMACLCSAFSRFVKARRILQKEEWMVDAVSGGRKAHPMLAVEQAACNELISITDKLGLSPTSRDRVARLIEAAKAKPLDAESLDADDDE